MTRFRVVAVDDEPLARRMVAALLRADDEVEEVLECADAASALETIRERRPDIVFLDIEMPDVTGLDLARELKDRGPVVVFVTAFNQYAADAFEVEASDYVLKPFSERRFSEALQRAKRRARERRLGIEAGQTAPLAFGKRTAGESDAAADTEFVVRLVVRHADRKVVIETSDVRWIEADDYYVRVHSARGRHLLRTPMAALEARLDPREFVRVHRGAIVNMQKVAGVRDDAGLILVLDDGAEIPVSRSKRAPVDAMLVCRRTVVGSDPTP